MAVLLSSAIAGEQIRTIVNRIDGKEKGREFLAGFHKAHIKNSPVFIRKYSAARIIMTPKILWTRSIHTPDRGSEVSNPVNVPTTITSAPRPIENEKSIPTPRTTGAWRQPRPENTQNWSGAGAHDEGRCPAQYHAGKHIVAGKLCNLKVIEKTGRHNGYGFEHHEAKKKANIANDQVSPWTGG